MATQSMPTVSWRSIRKASFSFVPTPSVPLTRTGSRSPLGSSKAPPNPPRSVSTPGTRVRATELAMSRTASYPASTFTPLLA